MVSGTRFVLNRATLTIDSRGKKRVLFTVPAGAKLEVLGEPDSNDKMVNVRWRGKVLSMFAVDLMERGQQVSAFAAAGD